MYMYVKVVSDYMNNKVQFMIPTLVRAWVILSKSLEAITRSASPANSTSSVASSPSAMSQ